MKNIMFRTEIKDYSLQLDFNKNIKEVLELLDINLNTDQILISQVNNSVININKSFTENEIENNDVLKIKG